MQAYQWHVKNDIHHHLQVLTANQKCVEQWAETLGHCLKKGDLITLNGDLGAGKSTFARALVRTTSANPHIEVPSPTFTLVQTYDGQPFGQLAHLDLYRLEDAEEAEALGLDDMLQEGAALVEWPQKAQNHLPEPTLALYFENAEDGTKGEDEYRNIHFYATTDMMQRLKTSMDIRLFLDQNNHHNSQRYPLTGDASARLYETIHSTDHAPLILMNAPAQPDGPPIKDGKPYSQIAHIAEDVRAFVAIASSLKKQGFNAPNIYHHDMDKGLLLIEDLGREGIIDKNRQPIEQRYLAAIEVLAALHEKTWDHTPQLPDGKNYSIPFYEREALLIEVDLLAQWFAPHHLDRPLSQGEYDGFLNIWNGLIDRLEGVEQSLVLRDYHSPNILWQEEKTGLDRIALIDFQDAVIGPSAYDVASIAQDARVNISKQLEETCLAHYCRSRKNFNASEFRAIYAIMAAQRVTKILGIFIRLSRRDNKHAYLAHLPRMEEYLKRSLSHPDLADYQHWLKTVLNFYE